jgi:anti-sigma factor RsiW
VRNHPIPHPDLAGYTLGILEPDEAEAFEAHLEHCATCRAEVTELEALPDLIRTTLPISQAPPDLEVRTFAAIEREFRANTRRASLRRLCVAAVIAVLLVAAGVAVRQWSGARRLCNNDRPRSARWRQASRSRRLLSRRKHPIRADR